MQRLTKTLAAAGIALGLSCLLAPARAASQSLPYTYSFSPGLNGSVEQLTLLDPFSFSLTNVTINESLLSNPAVAGLPTTTDLAGDPLVITPGGSITSDTGSAVPTTFALPFGPQPQNILIDPNTQNPLPFVLTATATGNGQTYTLSLTQTYLPDGTPAAVPEAGTAGLAALGLGLLVLTVARRMRRAA